MVDIQTRSDSIRTRRHKTAAHLARQLIAVPIHRLSERRFAFLGYGGYALHDLAHFC